VQKGNLRKVRTAVDLLGKRRARGVRLKCKRVDRLSVVGVNKENNFAHFLDARVNVEGHGQRNSREDSLHDRTKSLPDFGFVDFVQAKSSRSRRSSNFGLGTSASPSNTKKTPGPACLVLLAIAASISADNRRPADTLRAQKSLSEVDLRGRPIC
jgi:hypothetical protein